MILQQELFLFGKEPEAHQAAKGIGNKIKPVGTSLAKYRCLHYLEQTAVGDAKHYGKQSGKGC